MFHRRRLLHVRPPFVAAAGLGLRTSLTAFWSLESNASWTDDTGNGTTLTGNGTPPNTTTGKVGNGVSLNGSSDYLSAANNTNIAHGGGAFSMQAWVNASVIATGSILSKSNNAFNQRDWYVQLRFNGSANVFSWRMWNTGSTTFDCDSAQTNSAGWHHIVMTYDGAGAMKIYVDNNTPGTQTLSSTANSSTGALNIGRNADDGVSFLTGTIDQVGYWKGRVLSAADVSALYNGGAGLSYAAMA
jgi:hypothetical protein